MYQLITTSVQLLKVLSSQFLQLLFNQQSKTQRLFINHHKWQALSLKNLEPADVWPICLKTDNNLIIKILVNSFCITSMHSPSLKVDQLCVQQGNGYCRHGSPSGLHDNFVGLLHSGKSADLLRIHTRCHGCSRPLACQTGLSSPVHQLPVGMDPMIVYFSYMCFLLAFKKAVADFTSTTSTWYLPAKHDSWQETC